MKKTILLFCMGLVLIGTLIILLPRGDATVTFSQTPATLTATITGNETINSVYTADLVSLATLRTKTGQTAKDTSLQTMQYPLRLADSKYFTGSQFTVYVYNWLHVTAANIVFPCVLINSSGATININITLTGNGTYNIGATGFYITSCTQCQVTYETGTGATFAYKVNQSRYGAIWHPYNTTSTKGYQAWGIDSVKLDLGGASNTPTNFSFKNLNMNFFSSGRYATSNAITPNVYVRTNTHTSFENCQFFWNYTSTFSNYSSMISLYSNYNVLISNCSFMAYRHYQMQAGGTTNVYINNSVFKNLGWVVGRLHLRDVTFISGSGDSSGGSLGGNMGLYSVNVVESDSVYVTGCVNAIKCNAYNFWLNGTTLKSNTYFLAAYAMAFTGKLYNVVSDTWTICPLSTWSGGSIIRLYSFNLKTVNATGSDLEDVWVNITNNTGVLVFSGQTDSDGLIPTRLLNTTAWRSNTPVWSTPYWVNLSYGGWHSCMVLNITSPVNWTIPVPIENSPVVDVTENLINCVGTFEYRWDPLLYKLLGWANYTGIGGGTGAALSVHNPNPGNGTCLGYNYLQANVLGTKTCVDVSYQNFTVLNETNLGTGKLYEHSDDILPGWDGYFTTDGTGGIDLRYQNFTIGGNGNNEDFVLNKISVYLSLQSWWIGSDILNLRVYGCNVNGSPDLNNLITSGSIDTSIISAPEWHPEWYNISVTPVLLSKTTSYCYLLNSSFDSILSVEAYYDLDDFYTAGGVWWNNVYIHNFDYFFKLYGWSLGGNITWDHVVNLSFSDNHTGVWLGYGGIQYAANNGTYCVLNTNFSGVGTYYWRVEAESNHSVWFNTSVFSFTTVRTVTSGSGSTHNTISLTLGLTISMFLGCLYIRERKKRKQK